MINRRNNKKINLNTCIFFILIYLLINFFLNINFIKVFGFQDDLKNTNKTISVKDINEIIPENKRTISILDLYKDNKEKILKEIQKIDPLLENLRKEYLQVNSNQITIMVPENKKEELNLCGKVVVNIKYIRDKITNIEEIIPSKKRNINILLKDKDNKEKILKEIQKTDPLLENLRPEYLQVQNDQVTIIIPENKKEELNIYGKSIINLNSQNDDSEKEIINNSKNKTNQTTSNKFNIWFWLMICLIILSIILLFSFVFYYKNKKKNIK